MEFITDGILSIANNGVINIIFKREFEIRKIEEIKLDFSVEKVFYF